MKSKILFTLLLTTILFFSISAQEREITGTVTDGAGSTIPGVNVIILGTGQGVVTDFDGKYTVNVSDLPDVKLQFSYIGYITKVVEIGDMSVIDIVFEMEATQMEEIVVTALGIKRKKKALGYSATDIKGDALTEARESNIMNSISGKVAGVQISSTSGGAGGSSRVVIRGNSSISGNNQALIVVDGVPIDNSNHETTNWNSSDQHDYGDGVSDINPDDIESLTILKGPNAAALYGSRAANGVVIITTKKGRKKKGIGVSFSSTTTIETADIQAEYQNKYGMGDEGNILWNVLTEEQKVLYPGYDSLRYIENPTSSWGPEMNGQEVLHWYGKIGKLEAHPDNVKDFFETGFTTTNSIAIDGGNEKATFRLSNTNLYSKNIIPNSWYKRNSITLRSTSELSDKINIDAKVNYVRGEAFNRAGQSNTESGAKTLIWLPRNMDINKLKEYYKDQYGYENNYYEIDQNHKNPFWHIYENTNNDEKDRVIGNLKLDYQITDWLSLLLRTGTDFYNEKRFRRTASYSLFNQDGQYSETKLAFRSMNSDFLFNINKSFGDFDIGLSFGGNKMTSELNILSSKISALKIPDFFSLNNYVDRSQNSIGTTVKRKHLNSLYAFSQIAYKSFIFVDITARKDWSSSLPYDNNSYFYPSVSTSFVINEAFNIRSKIFTFGKIRVSWAKVGNDADPHLLEPEFFSTNYGSQSASFLSSLLPLSNLKPEQTYSWEAGADLRFFQNKIGVDFTAYSASTVNQILRTEVSKTTGFDVAMINAGEIENKGIELLISVEAIKTKDFSWNFTVNFAKNMSEVINLGEVETFIVTGTSQVSIEARPGNSYGDIIGYYILRDSITGQKLVDPVSREYTKSSDMKILGNITPDWTGGISNSIGYKNLYMSFSIGVQMGGDIYSGTNQYGMGNGQFVETLEGRESWYAATDEERINGVDAQGNPIGYVPEGVYPDGTVNDKGMNPKTYFYQGHYNKISEFNIYDASYVKLRELVIGFNIPEKISSKFKLNRASFSLVGRNLWLIYSGVPNIDPESSFSNQNNGLGLEYFSTPTARSLGFTLKLNF